MAAERRSPRERRTVTWPWLVMPLIVIAVFCALVRVHHRPGSPWPAWLHPGTSDESSPAGQ